MSAELLSVVISVLATSIAISQSFRKHQLNERIEETRSWQILNDTVENLKIENESLRSELNREKKLRLEDLDRLRQEIKSMREANNTLIQQSQNAAVLAVQLKAAQDELAECISKNNNKLGDN